MNSNTAQTASRPIRSYVIRSRMTPAQKKTCAAYMDSGLVIPVPETGAPRPLNPAEIFPAPKEKYLVDFGFGMGRSTALMAEKNPAAGYIGIEVHVPGVARLLWEIHNRRLENIRVIHGDGFAAVRDMLAAKSIDGFHIFFPDPWPKKRHHKRRLLTEGFLRLLASRLKTGGYLYIVTDWQDYAVQVEEALLGIPELPGVPAPAARVPWRPETAFEKKGISAGRSIHEIFRVSEQLS